MRTSKLLFGFLALTLVGCNGERPEPAGGESSGADDGPTSDDPSGSSSTTSDDGDGDGGDDGEDSAASPRYDVGAIPDAPGEECEGSGGNGGLQLSYIWIANSSQGTISKINTQTVEEEGRYYAKPSGGDPSRTSVNLNGDVAVANRNGGVAKFWASPDDCSGANTSEGSSDIKPWGEDDCLDWYTPFTCSSNRPVAWTRGEWNQGTCAYHDAKLWTVCDADVMLLNGDTGEVEETVVIPGSYSFVYGGAADADGNFWMLDYGWEGGGGYGGLLRVDRETLELTSYNTPPSGGYGITVDSEGRPWLCGGGGVSRFNLDDESWDEAGSVGGIGGCMTDGENRIWHSDGGGTLLGYDIETLSVDAQVNLPEYVHGVSVDFHGYVWGVSFAGSNAYRADPDSGDVETYSQLIGAYTYSDMTGFALAGAGGGSPQG